MDVLGRVLQTHLVQNLEELLLRAVLCQRVLFWRLLGLLEFAFEDKVGE